MTPFLHVGAHLRSPNRDHPCVGAPHPSDERIGASKLGVRRASCVGDIAARAPWRHRRAGASQGCIPTVAFCKRLTGIHFSHPAATILRGSAASLGRKDRRAQNSVPRERATGVLFALIWGFPRVWDACMARPWCRRKTGGVGGVVTLHENLVKHRSGGATPRSRIERGGVEPLWICRSTPVCVAFCERPAESILF